MNKGSFKKNSRVDLRSKLGCTDKRKNEIALNHPLKVNTRCIRVTNRSTRS